ncbi:MAG: tetratricopeptide repeat protein [Elusimicrobiaceae bacterium]|jgi:tol-pal system protein YbgF|nr:tetratricopeptide repeat protein [Elusimicrobiaceae bacterium]
MNRNIKIFCLGGLGLLLSGCIASERDMGTLKLQLKELNDTIAVMQVNQAELASKMEELNQNLSVSNENLSQLDAQIFNLSAKLDDINVAVKSGQSGAENTGEQKVLLPSDIFNEAKNHLNKQAYDLAVTGFKLYIEQYPEGENIEQAYIYMGDAYFAQEQAKPAAIAYATVLQKFPESKIIPTARLKYARSIIPLGKTEEAKRYFSSVVQDFGSSPEARLAKEELAKLK